MKLNLFEKTELCIRPVVLDGVNLSLVAHTCAHVLKLDPRYIQVIDARDDLICLDVTAPELEPEQFFGKERALLDALSSLAGLQILPETGIHSAGILGALALSAEEGTIAATRSCLLSDQVTHAIIHRALILPSGTELERGLIQDTNSPFLKSILEGEGFHVSIGVAIPDILEDAIFRFRQGVEDGYGLIISTGGVGAEAKDVNVEAMAHVTESAYTPIVVSFTEGQGRHAKAHVRIGVGITGYCTIINLPGPHDEVEAAVPAILRYLRHQTNLEVLSQDIAAALKSRWVGISQAHPMGDTSACL